MGRIKCHQMNKINQSKHFQKLVFVVCGHFQRLEVYQTVVINQQIHSEPLLQFFPDHNFYSIFAL